MPKLTPFLWFATEAEEAANYYCSIFPSSKVTKVSRMPDGSVMAAQFSLDGQDMVALNGNPQPQFSDSVSLLIDCKTQEEIDWFWSKLTADGGKEGRCGWLKDKYGFSWQVVPALLGDLMSASDRTKAGRAIAAMMTMNKLDIVTLINAFEGK